MGIISEVTNTELPVTWERACTGKHVPLPAPGTNYFDAVRESTAQFIKSSGQALVTVDEAAAKTYVDSFNVEKFDQYVTEVNQWTRKLPLRFDNFAQELNMFSIIDLLQIGSGFRRDLHAACGRGASDTIVFGCISLHISQTPVDAKGLQELTLGDISQHFGIPLFGDEKPMREGVTAVTVSEASPVRPLAEIILGILQDTGRRLEQFGFASFADFIIKICTEQATAKHLVEKLVNAFPSLRDAAEINGKPVYLFKKAQLIAYDVFQRFKDSEKIFNFPDVAEMTLFADNVVPAMVQNHGMMTPCDAIQKKIDSSEELTLEETTAMRAASIVAAQLVVDYANSTECKTTPGKFPINQATLDNFWWKEGKDPELRKINRLVCKNTVYF
ncbi:hypothetical protein EC988_004096 [Linderina pennispora]|nr:hypothetical protein EC988_004096 [Linderina pennispora]